MNIKLVTIDRLKFFLSKFSKVATSGKYSDLSGTPTKISQFTNDAGYAKITDIPTYTAGEGIKIENGVISIINNKVGNPVANGYTLYGNYFLSNTITPNLNWQGACATTPNVIVTQYYTLGSQLKIVTARVLSKAELETLTAEQRKINENGHYWYWTSTHYSDSNAWTVGDNGSFYNYGVGYSGGGGARLGFKNQFI